MVLSFFSSSRLYQLKLYGKSWEEGDPLEHSRKTLTRLPANTGVENSARQENLLRIVAPIIIYWIFLYHILYCITMYLIMKKTFWYLIEFIYQILNKIYNIYGFYRGRVVPSGPWTHNIYPTLEYTYLLLGLTVPLANIEASATYSCVRIPCGYDT